MGKRLRLTTRMRRSGRRRKAFEGILTVSDDIEILFDPWKNFIQIGMGGEWWSDNVKLGSNIIHHRKERVDEGYAPVTVLVKRDSKGYKFFIGGGFGYGPTEVLLTMK